MVSDLAAAVARARAPRGGCPFSKRMMLSCRWSVASRNCANVLRMHSCWKGPIAPCKCPTVQVYDRRRRIVHLHPLGHHPQQQIPTRMERILAQWRWVGPSCHSLWCPQELPTLHNLPCHLQILIHFWS